MTSVLSIPCQIDRRDAEVGVAELALDDVQRHALPGHLDAMGVTELVRSETASHCGVEGEPPKLCSCGRARPRAPASPPVDDAEERAGFGVGVRRGIPAWSRVSVVGPRRRAVALW
jgi:hypothetical protein